MKLHHWLNLIQGTYIMLAFVGMLFLIIKFITLL